MFSLQLGNHHRFSTRRRLTKSKKIYPILNLAFKIIVAFASVGYIGYVIFYQENEFNNAENGELIKVNFSYLKKYLLENISEHPYSLLFILFTFALTFANFGTEILKWKLLMGKLLPVNTKLAIRSVLGGVAASNITPYSLGSYFGRVAQVPFPYRLKGISIIFIGDTAQFTSTILMGSSSLFFLIYRSSPDLELFEHQRITLLLITGLIVAATIGFIALFLRLKYFAYIMDNLKAFSKVKKIWSVVSKLDHKKTIGQLLIICCARLVVILVQYYLVFQVFGLTINMLDSLLIAATVMAVYSFIPAINILEFGLTKAGIFLILLQTFVSPALATLETTISIICSLFLIWLMNLALPSIIGSYHLFKVKLFNH